MTKISNLPQDTNPSGDDFVPTYETTSGQTHKVLLSDIGEYVGSYPQNPYKFRAYKTAAQNTVSAITTKTVFDSESYDTNSNFDTTLSRYTAPISGFYYFDAAIGFAGPAGYFNVSLSKNGTTVSIGTQIYISSGFTQRVGVHDTLQLSANDYIEVFYYCDGIKAMEVGSVLTHFSGHLVSAT